ncbi:MAG: ABC transporter ATP-binding protein [Puniceicoccales bacterium]|jgi:ABC-type dipeptide/oligopeptide/nickel transport system ATPase component|nr:ABC transporter ATP-binding protein [Puniceicoccales bacterium]
MDPPLLSIENLRISFPNKTSGAMEVAVDGVNLQLKAGKILALVGPSGAGKSLTALAIGQLLPSGAKVDGTVLFEGRDVSYMDEGSLCRLRRKKLAYVFQSPMACFNPIMRVGKQLTECLQLADSGRSKKNLRSDAIRWLEQFNLSDPRRVFNGYPHELSGGMLQRVMLAMALCRSPKLLVADEPTAALDGHSREIVLELIRSLQAKMHFAILFITHDPTELKYFDAESKSIA